MGAGGQIFRPQGGWVSGRVIERRHPGRSPCASCCDGRDVALGEERPMYPPLTKRQSSLQHRAGSRHTRGPRPTFGSENVRGIGVICKHPVIQVC